MDINLNIKEIHSDILKQISNPNLISNPLDTLKSFDKEIIKKLSEYENNIELIDCLVPNACKFNLTDLVIWLIENNFYYNPPEDKINIKLNNNKKLMNYYKNLGINFL